MLNDEYRKLENTVTNMIIENKDQIRFIEKYENGFSIENYEFRLYLKKRNIFGFKKYITIITDDPTKYSYALTVKIIIPSFISDIGFDDELEIQSAENTRKLSPIFCQCYNDKSRLNTIKDLFKILYTNFYKKDKQNEIL